MGRISERLLIAALACVMLTVVVRAAAADITWDEAWTYFHYGRSLLGFLVLDYANDHILNSIAVAVSTGLAGASVFVIRLPNVLAGALYLAACHRLVQASHRAKLASFAITVLNPYLIEHFSLARGYGIATALLQWALVEHVMRGDLRRSYPRLLAFTLLAALAIGPDITIVAGFVVARAVLAWSDREAARGWIVASALACIASLPILGTTLYVTRPALPVFGSTDGPFHAIAGSVAAMYVPSRLADAAAAAGLVLVGLALVAARRHLARRTLFLLAASAVEIAVILIAAMAFGRKLPTDRLLVPSLPLWNLAIVSLIEDLASVRPLLVRRGSILLALACATSFVARTHAERFRDWGRDAGLEARLARALPATNCLPADVAARFGHEYYLDRWFHGRGGPRDVACPPGK